MPKSITKETIESEIDKLGIKTIELQYLDPTGEVHSMILSAKKLKYKDDEYTLVPNEIGGTLDGSSIPGFQHIDKTGLEIVLGPKPRIYVDPIDPTRLVVMGNTQEPNGPLYAKDPRNQAIIAEKWLTEQADLDLAALRVGPEFEFFVFPKGVDPLDLQADNTNYHCSAASNPSQAFMEEYMLALQAAGVDSRFFHAEVANYQQEIGVNCETLLRAADNVIIQRDILLKLAKKHGVTVSWEPKILDAYGETIKQTGKAAPINGSGLHTNMSFDTKKGTNAFVTYDDDGRPVTNELSDLAQLCIAGLLKHANALQAIYNPSSISGLRLGMGESPKFIVAGHDNRSALIRIVTVPKGEEFKTRIELRAADSMACPHTWFAAAQMAMVDAMRKGQGMSVKDRAENGLIPKIIDTNFYQMTSEKRDALDIHELHIGAHILEQSVASLEKDHRYLLSPDGPFGEDFSVVLQPYVDTMRAKDVEREICRKETGKAWIKAHSEAPGVEEELRRVRAELDGLKLLLPRLSSVGSGRRAPAFFNTATSTPKASSAGEEAQPSTRATHGSYV